MYINITIIGSRDGSNFSKVRENNVAVSPCDDKDESGSEIRARTHQDEADFLESML